MGFVLNLIDPHYLTSNRYTHYYSILDHNEWNRIWPALVSEIPRIIEAADVPVKLESDLPEDPLIDSERGIRFNGIGQDGHETFILQKEDVSSFDFCKTARKPYDLTVCVILLRAKQLAGDAFSLR